MKKISVLTILTYIIITFLALACLFPFILLVSASFTEESSIYTMGYSLIPEKFSIEAYKTIFTNPTRIMRAYGITFGVTTVGTILGLFLTTMAGYVLQRKDFEHRNKIMFFIYFTTLFSGGLVPWYILICNVLHLKDTYFALFLPVMLSAWNIMLMRNFIRSIPYSITESAKIDGANDFTIYCKLILPLSKPGIATVGLFLALQYWNDWYMGSLFISNEKNYPLQLLLYNMLKSAEFARDSVELNISNVNNIVPTESLKMATAVVVTGPIILLYPFVQKYFVKGLTIGAVKG